MSFKSLTAVALALLLAVSACGCEAKTDTPDAPGTNAGTSAPGGEEEQDDASVSVQWAENLPAGLSEYDEFSADSGEASARVLFSADGAVTDFKILALTLQDVNDKGNSSFLTEEVYALDELSPERPLVVEMTFYGTIPNYGFSYVDASGATRSFAITESGNDGSILTIEF